MWNPLKPIEKRLDKIEQILDGGLLFTGLVDKVRKLESRAEMQDYGPKSQPRPTSDWDVANTSPPVKEDDFEPPEDALQPGKQTLALIKVEMRTSPSSGRPVLHLQLEDDEGRKGWAYLSTGSNIINTLMILYDLLQEKIAIGDVGFPCRVRYVKRVMSTRTSPNDEITVCQIDILRFAQEPKEPTI